MNKTAACGFGSKRQGNLLERLRLVPYKPTTAIKNMLFERTLNAERLTLNAQVETVSSLQS